MTKPSLTCRITPNRCRVWGGRNAAGAGGKRGMARHPKTVRPLEGRHAGHGSLTHAMRIARMVLVILGTGTLPCADAKSSKESGRAASWKSGPADADEQVARHQIGQPVILRDPGMTIHSLEKHGSPCGVTIKRYSRTRGRAALAGCSGPRRAVEVRAARLTGAHKSARQSCASCHGL